MDPERRDVMVAISNTRALPQLHVDGHYMGNFDTLQVFVVPLSQQRTFFIFFMKTEAFNAGDGGCRRTRADFARLVMRDGVIFGLN